MATASAQVAAVLDRRFVCCGCAAVSGRHMEAQDMQFRLVSKLWAVNVGKLAGLDHGLVHLTLYLIVNAVYKLELVELQR